MIYRVELIHDFLKENNLTNQEFCKIANIKQSELIKFFSQSKKISLRCIHKIACVLELEVYEILA